MMMVWLFVGTTVTTLSGVMVYVLKNIANPKVLASQPHSNKRWKVQVLWSGLIFLLIENNGQQSQFSLK